MSGASPSGARILAELKRRGMLLAADAQLPSVAGLVAGEPIRGSWWGHPKGGEIFNTLDAIEDGGEVLFVKLVAGKVTLVHRRLWAAVVAVGSERAPWQTSGLTPAAKALLARVEREAGLRSDDLSPPAARAVPELERRLLAHVRQFHTEKGKHAKRLFEWRHWAETQEPPVGAMRADDARRALEECAAQLAGSARRSAGALLPWQTEPRPRRPRRGPPRA